MSKIIEENRSHNSNDNDNNDTDSDKDSEDIYEKYDKHIDKIILIQKEYRKYKERIDGENHNRPTNIKNKRTNKIIKPKIMQRAITTNTYKISVMTKKKTLKEEVRTQKNGGKNELEEIVSIDDTYHLRKKSVKGLNLDNSKVMEVIKNSMVVNNNTNLLKMNPEMKNYFNLLNDFGDKLSLIKPSNNMSKKFKLTQISITKHKREILTRKTKDNIRGNFLQKNERVVRYQGGFLKKTRKKNGFGIITWSDDSKLKGVFTANEINGFCRFYNHKYRSTFIGEYEKNNPAGFGVYSVKSYSIQGYWKSDNLDGIAIEVWDDGSYFQGEYYNNKKNGVGLYRWPDGTIYQGEFKDNQMNGRGIILYSNDCIFSGEIDSGFMNGFGYFFWGNGSMYIGYYIQDIKNGFGIYIWDQKNFLCYIGFWEMGKQQGIGAKVNGNKIKYYLWNKGKISVNLKGLYEIDKYLSTSQKKYYNFFTPNYISKLKLNNFFNFDEK